MVTGFRASNGQDIDDRFDFYQQGTQPGLTGFRTSDGADIRSRYAPISFGSKGADVGFRLSNGSDISNLFAAKGTASYRTFPSQAWNVEDSRVGAAALAGVRLNANGSVTGMQSTGEFDTGQPWTSPLEGGIGANYEAFAQITGGSLSSGSSAVNSWINISGEPSWRALASTIGSSTSCALTVRIRLASSGEVLSTSTITITADQS